MGHFKEAFGWERAPNNVYDFLVGWIPLHYPDFDLKMSHFAIVAWGFWTNRNKITIKHKFPTSPINVLYPIGMLLQK